MGTEAPYLSGVFRFVARLHTLSRRGMRMALAGQPKCRYGMLQSLYNLIEQHGRDGVDLDCALGELPFGKENDLAIITRDYHASAEQAGHLFRQMWIYTYGLCVMSAAGLCAFSDGEIASLLGEMFAGMIHVIRSGGETVKLQPVPEQSAASRELRSQSPDLRR